MFCRGDNGYYYSSDRKDWLTYLINFRTIVESDMTTEEKLHQINNEMSQSSESHKDIYKKLVIERQFPDILCWSFM